MPLTELQEKKIAELRQGITAAPVPVVHNNRSCLLELLAVVDQLGKLTPEHEKAVAEVKANVAAGASVLSNSRAALLVVFDAIDAAKSKPPKAEPKV